MAVPVVNVPAAVHSSMQVVFVFITFFLFLHIMFVLF